MNEKEAGVGPLKKKPVNLDLANFFQKNRSARTPSALVKLSIGSGFALTFLLGCLLLLAVWQLEKRRSQTRRMQLCLRVSLCQWSPLLKNKVRIFQDIKSEKGLATYI